MTRWWKRTHNLRIVTISGTGSASMLHQRGSQEVFQALMTYLDEHDFQQVTFQRWLKSFKHFPYGKGFSRKWSISFNHCENNSNWCLLLNDDTCLSQGAQNDAVLQLVCIKIAESWARSLTSKEPQELTASNYLNCISPSVPLLK